MHKWRNDARDGGSGGSEWRECPGEPTPDVGGMVSPSKTKHSRVAANQQQKPANASKFPARLPVKKARLSFVLFCAKKKGCDEKEKAKKFVQERSNGERCKRKRRERFAAVSGLGAFDVVVGLR